jgi:hypothetical protein
MEAGGAAVCSFVSVPSVPPTISVIGLLLTFNLLRAE